MMRASPAHKMKYIVIDALGKRVASGDSIIALLLQARYNSQFYQIVHWQSQRIVRERGTGWLPYNLASSVSQ